MGKDILTFRDIETEKKFFYGYKNYFFKTM